MDVIGLTPIDSALSIWGLNVSQALTEFFFINTKLGIAAFIIGFFWSLWEMAKKGRYKSFIVFIFITISGVFLFILPKRLEPQAYKSKMEELTAVSISTKTLKESQTSLHNIPVVLSFIAQGADGIVTDAIEVVDQSVSDDKKFLKNPFELQKLSLEANQSIYASINDVDLRNKIESFIYSDYLPSLIIYKSDVHAFDGNNELKDSLIAMAESPWGRVQDKLRQIGSATDTVQKSIATSIIRGQMHQEQSLFIWPLSSSIYNFFPYILGWANFCLYAAFPLLMLVLIVFRRMSIFLRYVEVFVWIKSWVLTAALSHYISLIAFRMQAQIEGEPNWFWEYPYYSFIAAMLLCLTPALSFIGIHKGFQFITHRFN